MSKINENQLEASLPPYLKNDILALLEGEMNNSLLLDCLYCEVQGSINAALYGKAITEEDAVYLRRKYLGWEG